MLAEVVDRTNARMAERCRGAGFPLKSITPTSRRSGWVIGTGRFIAANRPSFISWANRTIHIAPFANWRTNR